LNQKSSAGDGPCYVAVDKNNNHVFVANYMGGSFSVLPVHKDGSLGDAIQTEKFIHNGVGKGQQGKPHAHSTVLSPDEKYLFVSDLGNDEILEYKYSNNNDIPLKKEDVIKIPAGNGPRHFEFHPNQKFAYSIQELTCDILAYSYKKGKLSLIQTIEGKPAGFNDKKSAADIHVSPDGKFLYSSNRDEINDIAIFSIQKDGILTFVGRQSVLGKTPRNFVIDPTGNYLLAANQNSDNIVIFKRDKETGLLNDTGERIEVGSPVCLKFGKIE
ncbi:MAG: lactonase family protein, partial [Sphingobacteriaceae bacterium]